MATASSSEDELSRLSTSAPTSPPKSKAASPANLKAEGNLTEDQIFEQEEEAKKANARLEEANRKAQAKRKPRKKKAETKAERDAKARELDELLMKSAAFSDILTKKTQVLGRVGSSLDGKQLGEHNLEMAKQPKCMINGTMRDYQLEGLTWMYEICSQGMSGILADEMGLGKTVQTIALIALLREQEGYLGPHLIVAPLSTLSNWMDEFEKWVPSIPVVMFHGTPQQRRDIFETKISKNLTGGRPNKRFPVVCTSYEMVIVEQAALGKINWEFIIIDEGHRMKNSEAKLFQHLQRFPSATRLLITGTPLQNNLKELWSLLHFLLPTIFTDWEAFESWFDFSELEDEEGTAHFIGDEQKQSLVKKIHMILQPLLLRRIKQDVAAYLPRKREYVLFAPMTKEQTDLYNTLTDPDIDSRSYLEQKAMERIDETFKPVSNAKSRSSSKSVATPQKPASLPIRESPRKKAEENSPTAANAFDKLMGKRGRGRPPKIAALQAEAVTPEPKTRGKRKSAPTSVAPEPKSSRSSRQSTPGSTRSRPTRARRRYKEAESDEERMSDDEFEAKLADEMIDSQEEKDEEAELSPEEKARNDAIMLAKQQIAAKKLGNPMAQLRLVCNSPHNFYNPWAVATDIPVDESIVTASGKMLLLDRLLKHLFANGHKVLVFSQFTTQLDILEDYCRELRGWNTCRLDGSVDQASRRSQIKQFNTDDDYKIFLLSTRAGGQGINLAAADTVILFDSDFNPQQDLQAQDRAHRIGQTRPVIVYRIATKSTVEETLLSSADAKRRLEKLVIQKGGFKTMGQKLNQETDEEGLDAETLRSLLLKDGQVFQGSSGDGILSEKDLDIICDRSDEAFDRAERGDGDADAYRVVETGADSITMTKKG
ncbi:SNF2 family N-terminal domain-containing protein [Emericellopsis atlantica]|uniref:SNF2 family N-terminal domain-containing protein n=1 Tax=Emericellopsis atlantica TaxID=2614577 RepID=A0A9P7ZJ21_9HYPO|nr:SNF2 family N-terminal domain-containing protein [Emericellopsis atlantica]KAG9252636.1 SNF2 family N-terminal domain-containing protein [Emericellopsis atlantica]